MKGRLIGIDYGTKRTGLAWSDPMQIIASGLEGCDTVQLQDKLKAIFAKEKVAAIVVGYPTKMDGSDTDSTESIRNFVTELKKNYPETPVHLWDERLSSRKAVQHMVNAGVPKKKRQNKYLVDQVSATLILQEFMQGLDA